MSEQTSAAPPKIRPSRAGRWRALVLILVHALAAIHIAHWLETGSTLTPVEPSEAMEFSKHGIINAGFIFFGLTILSTILLGRWFCGWACHLVALQDLCRWLLLKIGIRPRPLRSRLLVFVPLVAAIYMFVYPLAYRVWRGDDVGGYHVALTRSDFWATFPPWPVALVTFVVCGFVIIYFLGAKGFCTYGCPYGAIYGLADKLAVGRIRVTDACAGCAHCTAVCSSNVLVHAEVRDYGMVVDPGCMKCLDCVSVCPTNALYFGIGKPSLGAKPRREPQVRRAAYTWKEELLLGAFFVGTFFVVRGLYGAVPFLLALGLAAILAYLFLTLVRLAYRESVSLGPKALRRAGGLTRAGLVYVGAMVVVTAGVAHGALIQYHASRSAEQVAALGEWRDLALVEQDVDLPADERAVFESALGHARFVERFGWLSTAENESQLAALRLIEGDDEAFESLLRSATTRWRADPGWHLDLARFLEARGRHDEAVAAYERFLELAPSVTVYDYLARLHASRGDTAAAADVFRRALDAYPDSVDLRFNLGVALSMGGQDAEAIEAFGRVVELEPERADARDNLGGLLCRAGRFAEGIEQLRAAADLAPGDVQRLQVLVQAYLASGDVEGARAELRERVQASPDDERIRALLESLPR